MSSVKNNSPRRFIRPPIAAPGPCGLDRTWVSAPSIQISVGGPSRSSALHTVAVHPLHDPLHVLAGFSRRWHPSTLQHRSLAGVVGRKNDRQVVVESVHLPAKPSGLASS